MEAARESDADAHGRASGKDVVVVRAKAIRMRLHRCRRGEGEMSRLGIVARTALRTRLGLRQELFRDYARDFGSPLLAGSRWPFLRRRFFLNGLSGDEPAGGLN